MKHTPEPWEVEKDGEIFGRYTILKADKEQADCVDKGYEISDEEGDRRDKEAEERNEGNRRIIQAALGLYEVGKEMEAHLKHHPLGKGLKETYDKMKSLLSTLEEEGEPKNRSADQIEADLRGLWDKKGVPKERQDEIIREVEEKAKPGAMVGPLQIPE